MITRGLKSGLIVTRGLGGGSKTDLEIDLNIVVVIPPDVQIKQIIRSP